MKGLERQIHGGSRLPWIWHALFDGTILCSCPHSRWYKGIGPAPIEVRDATGRVIRIEYPVPVEDES